MNLYKFFHPDTEETLLLVTPKPRSDRALRGEMGDYDHGGMNWDVFSLLVGKGTCQYSSFSGRRCPCGGPIEDEKGHAILEVTGDLRRWGGIDDQHFYAQAYQNMKFLLEYIGKMKK